MGDMHRRHTDSGKPGRGPQQQLVGRTTGERCGLQPVCQRGPTKQQQIMSAGWWNVKQRCLRMGMWAGGAMHGQQMIARTLRCMLPAAVGVIVLANTCAC